LFLALMTLGFAFMAQTLFFGDPGISGGEGGILVPRPAGFQSKLGLYYLTFGSLLAIVALTRSLRSGRTGRVLAGMRDSEDACRSLGIQVTRYKVLIFALSASIAGAGALLNAMLLGQAGTRTYIPFYSLFLLAIAVLGGIFHIGGAIAAGLLFGLYHLMPFEFLDRIQFILFGLGATLALAQNPEGLFGELRRGGHAVLRLLQRRRGARIEPAPVAGGGE
jgi:branched-chain amino acid transport system permease protein